MNVLFPLGTDFAGVSRAEIIEWYLKEHEDEFDSLEAVGTVAALTSYHFGPG
jgi:hypothetical protein